jgi:hypothetical protein
VKILGTAIAAFHVVKTAGLVTNLASFPTLRAGAPMPGRPRTSILIPARDEATRLPKLLPGLLAQGADEVIVLDDESTDGTADLLAQYRYPRLKVIAGKPRPDGWIGKNWACHQLAEAATGDLLVFCDADVVLRPKVLGALWSEFVRQRADVVSVFPRQITGTTGERFLVPLIDETLLSFLPHKLLDLPVPSAATANGQVLAFRREAYAAIGGHQAVRDRIVEDIALGRRTRRMGFRLGLALGGDLVQARMYDDYPSAVAGFGKSLRAAHLDSTAVLVASAGFHLVAYTMPWMMWNRCRAWRAAAVLGLAERLLTNAKTGRGAYAEAALVPFTPLAALPVYAVAARRKARWKGREYA